MIAPRWRKVFKDLGANKSRTALVMITIAVSTVAIGFVSTLYIRLLGDMDRDFNSVNPHSAIIYTVQFPSELLPSLAKVPGVDQVEGRSTSGGTTLSPAGRKTYVNIIAMLPPEKMKIDRLTPAKPGESIALNDRQILIEKSARVAFPFKVGDNLEITMSDGTTRVLEIAGFVHDPTTIPYAFRNQITGYATSKTLEWLDGTTDFNMVYMAVSEKKTDVEHVNAVASAVAKKVENSGRQVFVTLVYEPGKHFAATITQALVLMMGVLGFLSVLLSAILVINTIDAVIGQQVRQIGVMKSIGASAGQITGMYLMLVALYGLLALLIAIPIAFYGANIIAEGFAEYLNYRPGSFVLPPITLAMQIIVGLGIPILATLVPVIRSARITVREAITSYGLGGGRFGRSWFDRLLEHVRGLPRPLLLSLRNTFRRKGSLIRTLIALSLAGTIFISVFNLRASMGITIDEVLGYYLSDVNVAFNRMYRTDRIIPLAMSIPGVEQVEAWGGAIGNIPSLDGKTDLQLDITAPPADSTLINPTLTAGRWLLPEDENAIVIGNHLTKVRPDLNIGDEIEVKIDNKEFTFKIVGIFRMAGNNLFPPVFVKYDYLASRLGATDKLIAIRVVTSQHDAAFQEKIADQMEALFIANDIDVQQATTGAYFKQMNTATTDILINFLLLMAGFIAIVGGFGLASTMSLNVIERIREIGVMRAIGASSLSIQGLVLVEGILIGVISWLLGALFAIPVGQLLSQIVGIAIVQSPLTFVFAWDGFMVWLIMIMIISALASSLPARTASRLTVREVLSYE